MVVFVILYCALDGFRAESKCQLKLGYKFWIYLNLFVVKVKILCLRLV